MAIKVVWLELNQDKNGTVYVSKLSEVFEDQMMADVKFNVVSDEHCPVYMLNEGKKVASCDHENLLPLYQWVDGKKDLETMLVWRSSFFKVITAYKINAALQCLDLAIARYIPPTELNQSHSFGLPEKVYNKYQVEYIDGESTKSKIFVDFNEAMAAFDKIVGKRSVKIFGLDREGKHFVKAWKLQ